MLGPIAVGATALAACAAVAAVDPGEPGRYPLCPFRALTGYWCPACGTLRATHHLLRGDLTTAASFNPLWLLVLPVAVYAWVAWTADRAGRPVLPQLRIPPAGWWTLLVVAVGFGVVRNAAGLVPAAASGV